MKIQTTHRKAEVVGHRGSAKAPENTMTAFRQGVKDGADRIEFDIRRTADGHYVVTHDRELDRTTNGTGNVDEVSLEYLRTLDAGDGNPPPTFEEVLDWAGSENVLLDIEVKSGKAGEIAGILSEKKPRDVWVKSFDKELIREFEWENPETTTGILLHPRKVIRRSIAGGVLGSALGVALGLSGMGNPGVLGAAFGLSGLFTGLVGGLEIQRSEAMSHPADMALPHHRFVTKSLMFEAAEVAGKSVVPWTVNSLKRGKKLINRGVAGLITDHPEIFKV
ncbi:MAG: glycerophosphodiester phosphodiesterase family protein [Vulcanimicrobiota bacterium]